MKKKHVIIPIFVPHKGCFFDCIYCNQRSISGQVEDITSEKMKEIIELHLSTLSEDNIIEIGFYGGSFTGIEKEKQIKLLEIANYYIDKKLVKEVRLSTRPDYINQEILDYLKFYKVKTIELGVQSLDNEVLKKSNRGHTEEDVFIASELIKKNNINLGIQTMLGLIGDTEEKAINTASKVIKLQPKIVRIYPTLVIKNTILETMYNKGEYSSLSIDEAIQISAVILSMYIKNNIHVIRVGLQPTDKINENMDVVSGPFHPAFRQMVESKIALNEIEEIITRKNLKTSNKLIIFTKNKYISTVIGQKRININYLKQKYNYSDIEVKSSVSTSLFLKFEEGENLREMIFVDEVF